MNAFVAVAERRSFAKAAVQLGVSRSRLSETIRGLEEQAWRAPPQPDDAQRGADGGRRAAAGAAAPAARRLRRRLDSINEFRDKPAGLLRLTVPPPVASLMLAPLLSRFLAQYPAIDLEISVDAALTDIVAGRFDAGIRAGERVERDMIAVRIGEGIRGVVVAAPDYLALHPRPMTPRDLETHRLHSLPFPERRDRSLAIREEGQADRGGGGGSPDGQRSRAGDQSRAGRRGRAVYGVSAMPRRRSRPGGWFPCWRIGGRPRPRSFCIIPAGDRCRVPLQAFIEFLRENLRAR